MSILGLLLAGAVVSTAIKVGVVVVGAKVYRARQRQREAPAPSTPAEPTADPVAASPTAEVAH